MSFGGWARDYTGLSLYDFRVLDTNDTSENQVQEIFDIWLDYYKPTQDEITEAIKAAAHEGFDIHIKEI